jgi:hypothetical protein
MLRFLEKKNKWSGKAQSGFYIDFLFKKFIETFIRNIFIYAALFFGEKYIIEHLTKKTIDSFIYNSNKFFGWTILNYMWFFYTLLTAVMYTFLFLNLILIFI